MTAAKKMESWGKCNDCDAEATFRFREVETARQKKAGKPGNLIGQYCAPHAYAHEVDSSPWRLMLPIGRPDIYGGALPPVRLLDGRLYEVAYVDRHPAKGPTVNRPFYDLDAGSLLYRPKFKAWVRKTGRTLATVTKEALHDGAMAKHFYEALNRLPAATGGKVVIVLRDDPKSKGNYHLGLLWVPNPKA